jgi:hypothetical protein
LTTPLSRHAETDFIGYAPFSPPNHVATGLQTIQYLLLFINESSNLIGYLIMHRPLTKGRITQQSSPERDESNDFSQNVFLASAEDTNLGTEPKLELIWSNG